MSGASTGRVSLPLCRFPACRFAQRSDCRSGNYGAKLARKDAMPVFSGLNLVGGLVFGSIGFVAFVYGKRMHVWKPMFLGIALMAYPFFFENVIALFAIGFVAPVARFLLCV